MFADPCRGMNWIDLKWPLSEYMSPLTVNIAISITEALVLGHWQHEDIITVVSYFPNTPAQQASNSGHRLICSVGFLVINCKFCTLSRLLLVKYPFKSN